MAKTKHNYNYINDLTEQLSELKSRAIQVGYKNQIPKLPEAVVDHPGVNDHLLIGFHKRLHNWTNGLFQIEHPNGLPQAPKLDAEQASITIEDLVRGEAVITKKELEIDIKPLTIYADKDGFISDSPPESQD